MRTQKRVGFFVFLLVGIRFLVLLRGKNKKKGDNG